MRFFNLFLLAMTFFSAEMAISEVYKLESAEVNKVTFLAVGTANLKFDGTGGRATGEVDLVGDKIKGSVKVALDDFKTGIKLRDKHMKEKYLKTKEHPEVLYVFSEAKVDSKFELNGFMTLNGVTKPIKSNCVRMSDKKFDCHLLVVLTDFGIDIPSWLGITVAKEIHVKALLGF